MRQTFIKDGIIRSFEVQGNKIIATLLIGGVWVSNPTMDDFYGDGWEEYIAPAPKPYVPTYEEKVIQLIREKYTIDDELAIQRQRETKVEQFNEYFAYCEECKRKAKENE